MLAKTRGDNRSMAPKPTLFLTVGLPGAGKTTLARQIEESCPALRLTPDDWFAVLGDDPFDQARRAQMEALLWGVAERALQLGCHVVLDYGLWSREEREAYRAKGRAAGARTELCFLDAPFEELVNRLAQRSARQEKGTVAISKDHMVEYARIFEAPHPDELVPDP
jgi:predicted kinase